MYMPTEYWQSFYSNRNNSQIIYIRDKNLYRSTLSVCAVSVCGWESEITSNGNLYFSTSFLCEQKRVLLISFTLRYIFIFDIFWRFYGVPEDSTKRSVLNGWAFADLKLFKQEAYWLKLYRRIFGKCAPSNSGGSYCTVLRCNGTSLLCVSYSRQ